MGNFSDVQGQLTPQCMVRRLNFKLSQDFMVDLVTSKIEEHPIKNVRCESVRNIIHQIFRRSRTDNSRVGGGIWPKFELIQAFVHVLFTCKNECDSIKCEGARVVTTFFHYVYGDFSRRSRAANCRSGRISNSF